MTVDLSDYIDNLKSEVNPPGSNFYPDAVDDDWMQQLQNGFWEARLDGFISSWNCDSDGLVTNVTSNGADIPRDLIQLIIFYAGFRILRATLRNLQTLSRSKAGPVEFEVQHSSNVIRDLLSEMQDKRSILLRRLSDLGVIPTAYIDAVTQRGDNIQNGDIYWTAGRIWSNPYGYT